MDLGSYISDIRQELAAVADAGGADARALAERLTVPLESALRLALLDVLSAAADEITRDLAPGSVQLRLQGREPVFVVTAPPADTFDEPAPSEQGTAPAGPTAAPDGDDSATARINFRLGEQLKSRIEEAADRGGLSVNSWLIRTAAAGLDSGAGTRPSDRRAPRGDQRFTGWVR